MLSTQQDSQECVECADISFMSPAVGRLLITRRTSLRGRWGSGLCQIQVGAEDGFGHRLGLRLGHKNRVPSLVGQLFTL
jgi:hypothetical protein